MEEWGDPCQLGSGPRSRLDIAELGNIGQAEDVVQLAVREQTPIRGDPGTVKLELDAAVEGDPKRPVRFTRCVRHDQPV